MQIQLQAVYADGNKHPAEDQILKHICDCLGYPVAMLSQLEAMLFAQNRRYTGNNNAPPSSFQLEKAYSVLGRSPSATNAEIKKAYRRLMNQHHPDKLIAKGLPDEMIKIATDKAQEIQKAYELVREERKLRH